MKKVRLREKNFLKQQFAHLRMHLVLNYRAAVKVSIATSGSDYFTNVVTPFNVPLSCSPLESEKIFICKTVTFLARNLN
jgi:hypothetical protein